MYERIAVARPADANAGPLRARSPEAIDEMRRLHRGGASMDAVAEQFGVSKRTVYRYLNAAEYFDIEVAGWIATFAVSEGKAPWRVSAWRRP
jgi:transposase